MKYSQPESCSASAPSVDESKRQTLITLTAVSAASFAGSFGLTYSEDAHAFRVASSHRSRQTWPPLRQSTPLQVEAVVSAYNDDLEIVISNAGNKNLTLTQVSPSIIKTKRGVFDLESVLSDGSVVLKPRQKLVVPIQVHADEADRSMSSESIRSLQSVVSTTVSLTTLEHPFTASSFTMTVA